MKLIITFALSAVLAITFASCGRNSDSTNQEAQTFGSVQSKEEVTTDTILGDTCTMHLDTTFLYSIELGHTEHRFYDLYLGGHYLIAFSYAKGDPLPCDLRNMTYVDLYYDRYNDNRNFLDEGSFYPLFYYARSNNRYQYINRYLYVVTGVGTNSNGWTSEYQLFKVDCKTLQSKLLLECAAIAVNEPYGFVVSQARLTNRETATCTADEIWVMHDEFIDWNGNVTRVDTAEYDYETMNKKYLRGEYTYVKGFYGVRR